MVVPVYAEDRLSASLRDVVLYVVVQEVVPDIFSVYCEISEIFLLRMATEIAEFCNSTAAHQQQQRFCPRRIRHIVEECVGRVYGTTWAAVATIQPPLYACCGGGQGWWYHSSVGSCCGRPAHISEVELDSVTAVCHRTPRYQEVHRANGGTAAAAAGTIQLSL